MQSWDCASKSGQAERLFSLHHRNNEDQRENSGAASGCCVLDAGRGKGRSYRESRVQNMFITKEPPNYHL